ncbi:T9SS type A sorting domain-containing protein [Flavobacterium sp. CYK-4]|nr:T9SS type A sorting domain-containing protein [Flavobacterium lotistagni]
MDAQATPDYGFILAGSSLSKNSGNKIDDNEGDLDYWIWKMDEDGELEWQKSFGGSGTDFLQSIRLTRDGGFILAGTSNSNKSAHKIEDSKGFDDFWVIKLNAGGGQQWQRTIGGSGQEKLQSICQTKDGGYILGGSSDSDKSGDKADNSNGSLDYWIIKLDKDGIIEWQKTYGGAFFDELRSIEETNGGGYIVGGYSNSPSSGAKSEGNMGIGDYWILKLDKAGLIEWQKTLGGNKDDQLYAIHQTYDNGFLIGGNSDSDSSFFKKIGNGSGIDFWIVKLDSSGNNLWQQTYDIGKTDILTSLVENDDHTILLGGFAKTEVSKNKIDDREINDFVGIKIKEDGEEFWRRSVGSSGEDILKKAIETRDGGYLLAGSSNSAKRGNGLSSKYEKTNTSVSGLSIGNGKQVKAVEDAISSANDYVREFNDEINNFYKEKVNKITDKINETVNKASPDSRIKMGMSTSTGNLLNNNSPLGGGNGGDLLDGLTGMGDNRLPNSKPSGDKEKNYGSSDFWVVKLKDKDKKGTTQRLVEAFPNPTSGYTNIIIGYNYEKGNATLVDLSGHILKQFEISSRTIPLDMSSYPMGIYILNVKTDKRTEGIKIMKN